MAAKRIALSAPSEALSRPFPATMSLLRNPGTQWMAVAHIITGVIGAGVLSLAWSVAQLGWILGPVCIVSFAGITIVSTFLLCDCYKCPDSKFGVVTNPSYMQAVKMYLGERFWHIVWL